MKYMTWLEYFHSKEFLTKLREETERFAPKIKITWTQD